MLGAEEVRAAECPHRRHCQLEADCDSKIVVSQMRGGGAIGAIDAPDATVALGLLLLLRGSPGRGRGRSTGRRTPDLHWLRRGAHGLRGAGSEVEDVIVAVPEGEVEADGVGFLWDGHQGARATTREHDE